MKRIGKSIIFIIILAFIGVFAACGSAEKLNSPQNLAVSLDGDGMVVSWSAVENARNYTVEIDGNGFETRRTSFDLERFDIEPGTYTVRVRANAPDRESSEWSSVSYLKERDSGMRYTLVDNGNAYEVTSIGSAQGKVVIEDMRYGKPIVSIGTAAFGGSDKLTEVVIGKNVTEIKDRAFNNCSFLTSVTIPDSVTKIGMYAFQSCHSLTDIEVPGSVKNISSFMFSYCRGLKTLTIGNGVQTIGESAFTACESLKSISLPKSVNRVYNAAFKDCTGLTSINLDGDGLQIAAEAFSGCGVQPTDDYNELDDADILTLDIGGNVTFIGSRAFDSCYALCSLNIPVGVQTVDARAFANCRNLTDIKIANTVTHIGSGAFFGTAVWNNSADNFVIIDRWLVGLKNNTDQNGDLRSYDIIGIASGVFIQSKIRNAIQMPASLKYINSAAFAQSDVSSVTVGAGVEIIGSQAFYGCENLTAVAIGANVKEIGDMAFARCKRLAASGIVGGLPDSIEHLGQFVFYETALWESSRSVISLGKWVVGCKPEATDIDIPNGTIGIADFAFEGCQAATSVYIPATVKNIGSSAFFNCTALRSVKIPSGVTEIKPFTFFYCISLQTVDLPNGVETIGNRAFYNCMSLENLSLPDSVTKIDDYAFYHAFKARDAGERESDVKFDLGNGIVEIGEWAFGTSALESVVLPDSLRTIGARAFYMSSLRSIDFGNGVLSIGERAFYKTNLVSAEIPDSVESIGERAFYKCAFLKSVVIGNNVTTIGNSAFYGCNSLLSVNLPDSVESIGDGAFRKCTSLRSVSIGINLMNIGSHVFYGCGLTLYSETPRKYNGWSVKWNSTFRPVLWNCTLAEDKSYVISVTVSDTTFTDSNAKYGITDPTRHGYTFLGWATEQDGDVVYSSQDMPNVPQNTTLYSVWEQM